MASPQFDAAEFQATLSRMAEHQDAAMEVAQPQVDKKIQLEVRKQAADGRRIEAYVQALESLGFTYYPPAALKHKTGIPKLEGEWRCGRLKMAFTEWDILTGYRSPEDFYRWVVDQERAKQRAANRQLVR